MTDLTRSFYSAAKIAFALVLAVVLLYYFGIFTAHSEFPSQQKRQETAQMEPNQKPLKLPSKCEAVNDFLEIDLGGQDYRDEICKSARLYQLFPNKTFPICELKHPMKASLLTHIRSRSRLTYLLGVSNQHVPMFVYKASDLISNEILKQHRWEQGEAASLTRIALLQSDTTFVDIGSNIGVYSVTAAAKGLPTVSVDGNIRNLMRLRLSLLENKVSPTKSRIVWNCVSRELAQITYMAFPSDCNIGGAPRYQKGMNKFYTKDPIGVMPLFASRITELIQTKNIVMKMDLEHHETVFLSQANLLLQNRSLIAVQIEWWKVFLPKKEEYFGKFRDNYTPYRTDLSKLDFASIESWVPKNSPSTGIDVLLLRNDFKSKVISAMSSKQ